MGMLCAWCPQALALDPSLDVSQYAHTAWRIREGFPNAHINALAQTSDGYLWLGTELGLLRYDGIKTVLWQPPAQALPDTFIRSLLVAHDGTLWIGTLKGLASWKDGKLALYKQFAGLGVDALLEDRQGTLWVGALGFPNGRLCTIQGTTVECHGEDGSLGSSVESLYEDHAGNLWAATANGLWRLKPGAPKLYPIPDLITTSHSLIESDDGALLITSRDGIRQLVNGRIKSYSVPGRRGFMPGHLLLDHDGGLWIGSLAQGLVHVHQGRADVFAKADGLSGDDIYSLFEDREGNVWVSTNDGLDRFRQLAVTTLDSSEGLSNGTAVLANRDGSIWFATLSGLNRLSNGRIVPVSSAGGEPDSKTGVFRAVALFQDDRGRIWVSTLAAFGYLEKDQFVPLSGLPVDNVRSIAQDNAGSIWIAYSHFALFRLSRNYEIEQLPLAQLGHEGDVVTALASDPLQGGLWVGFFNGGLVYFKDGRVRASYTAADGLGEGFVGDLRISPDGTLWASTHGGLSRLKNGHVATLSSRNGLPCNVVHWSKEDEAGSVWLYTACGLVHFSRSELETWATAANRDKDSRQAVRTAVLTDGVSAAAYAPGQTAKSSDGKLWFVTPGGVSVFDPSYLPYNKLPPPVHVEEIIADHKTYDLASQPNGQLRLPPLVRDLVIDYTALSFVEPERAQFRYKLEGWDSDWQDVGNRRQAFYSNLPPRNYRFRVIAANNSGVWNEAGDSLDISIAPAYYQTTWFGALCMAALVALLWSFYSFRHRQLQRQFEMTLDARVNERTHIARELHDTLLQSFQGLLLRFQTAANLLPARPEDARQKLESAIDQTARAITEGRDAVQGLRKFTVTTDLPQAVNALGQELADSGGGKTRAVFHVEVEGTPRAKHAVTRDEVYRITGEAIRNAFEHAQPRKVEVEIWYGTAQFRVRVRDDGRGIDPTLLSNEGRPGHFGLHGMRERARTIGGRLEIWSEVGCGTEVELSIPAERAYVGRTRRVALLEKWGKKFHRKETAGKL